MKRYFTVIIEKDEEAGLYVGEVPGLPGCHTHGETIDELMENMREVIELCLEVAREEKLPLPNYQAGLQATQAEGKPRVLSPFRWPDNNSTFPWRVG